MEGDGSRALWKEWVVVGANVLRWEGKGSDKFCGFQGIDQWMLEQSGDRVWRSESEDGAGRVHTGSCELWREDCGFCSRP